MIMLNKKILLVGLLILFSLIVMPYIYHKYVLKDIVKPNGLIIFFISIVFLAFVFAFGTNIYNKKINEEKQRQIVIKEIPYEVVKIQLVKSIDEIRFNKSIWGIEEVRDESDRKGLKIVIDISESELFVKQVNIEVLVAAMQKVKDSLKKRQEMELKQQLQAVQDPQMKLKLMQQYIQMRKNSK